VKETTARRAGTITASIGWARPVRPRWPPTPRIPSSPNGHDEPAEDEDLRRAISTTAAAAAATAAAAPISHPIGLAELLSAACSVDGLAATAGDEAAAGGVVDGEGVAVAAAGRRLTTGAGLSGVGAVALGTSIHRSTCPSL
jgi:hypothetical protein